MSLQILKRKSSKKEKNVAVCAQEKIAPAGTNQTDHAAGDKEGKSHDGRG